MTGGTLLLREPACLTQWYVALQICLRRGEGGTTPDKGVSGGWVCVASGAQWEGHADGIVHAFVCAPGGSMGAAGQNPSRAHCRRAARSGTGKCLLFPNLSILTATGTEGSDGAGVGGREGTAIYSDGRRPARSQKAPHGGGIKIAPVDPNLFFSGNGVCQLSPFPNPPPPSFWGLY